MTQTSASSAFATWQRERQRHFEWFAQSLSPVPGREPKRLAGAMRYALLGGGKRIRPLLCYAAGSVTGASEAVLDRAALALEMIHSYSLVHDDMPAMDNDEYRRGKPATHVEFGEGQAILAGDALMNEAYHICFEACRRGKTYIDAAAFLCHNAGAFGMVAGQTADLACQGSDRPLGRSESDFIIINKTAKMIVSAAAVPGYVYGADDNIISILTEFGTNLGFLFQITDDLLDLEGDFATLGKTPGKDAAESKLSAVALYGADACREQADRYAHSCKRLLDSLPYESSFLQEFVDHVRGRRS